MAAVSIFTIAYIDDGCGLARAGLERAIPVYWVGKRGLKVRARLRFSEQESWSAERDSNAFISEGRSSIG